MMFNEDFLKLDLEKTLNKILEFIREVVKEANASGVVLGLSGGVDSTLTAALCTRALGKKKVLGILMPTAFTPKEDMADALELAEMLGIRTERINIDGVCKAFVEALNIREDVAKTKMPLANIRARIRMIILYFYANANNFLVVGTGDRSEALIGFFTKHGDGAADFFPIRHLYKTQVRELAKYLGVSGRMAFKPSSPHLYPGHKLSDEVPLDYDRLDPVLVGLFDYRLPPEKVSEETDIPFEIIKEIVNRYNKTEHKRKTSPKIENV
ncbi:MAG: NAD+ synthase [Candidatus Bathyarchaeota archaeon]|nr:NAD+ synthase [Candidatus Bathyarchaeota archaeon]